MSSFLPAVQLLFLMYTLHVQGQITITPTATLSSSQAQLPSPLPLPTPLLLPPVFEKNITTYGNNSCDPYMAGGYCQQVLSAFPRVITNLSRSDQAHARAVADRIFATIENFGASQECIDLAVPLLCRYSFPTCDPAFREPTYQPVCQRDCRAAELFVCREPWLQMLTLADILNFDVIDDFNCDPLLDPEAGGAPMCISTVDVFQGIIPLSLQSGPDCYRDHGRGYNGTLNVTESGRECQAWDQSYPHQHLLGYERHPELQGGHNYCRNPGERGERPWCFTTDRSKRWEYCDIPECPGSACENYGGEVCHNKGTIGYDKVFIDKERDAQDSIIQADFEAGLENLASTINDVKYTKECRDVFLELLCATNFPSCDLAAATPTPIRPCKRFCLETHQVCGELIEDLVQFHLVIDYDPVEILFNCSVLHETEAGDLPECFLPIVRLQQEGNDTCYISENNGVSYHGTIDSTESGKTCQSWSSQTPHHHSFSPKARVYLSGHNYCRNPEGRGDRPWCFTTDPNTRWEYCDVPQCVTDTPSLLVLPLSTIIVIGTVVPAAVMLLILILLIAICTCWCCTRKSDSATFPIPKEYVSGASHLYVKSAGEPGKEVSELGPLYCRNPLSAEAQIEYDGVKLPEIPRDSIVYTKDLGQGHFGVVVQAEATSVGNEGKPQTVAVKVLKPGASVQVQKEFFREAALMNAFDHPHILRLFGVCIDQEPLCMVFEFMERGDLNNFLRMSCHGISVARLVDFCIEIASGLQYLGQNHYVHRDLATRNCLVSSNYNVKISDFGLSQDIYSSDYFTLGDTELLPIRWMPPEAILYSKFTTQSDVWSFGVVLWEIFSFGIQPYYTMSNEEVVQHVRDGNVMNCPDNCPTELYDLMIDCWAMNPTDRPTATELHDGLKRWTPNLSAMIEEEKKVTCNYQNMATVREFAQSGMENVGGSYDHLITVNDSARELESVI